MKYTINFEMIGSMEIEADSEAQALELFYTEEKQDEALDVLMLSSVEAREVLAHTTKLRIYQIDSAKDKDHLRFEPYDVLSKYLRFQEDGLAAYKVVYEGAVCCSDLEDVYIMFGNGGSRPAGFRGHSLSVSDIIEVVESDVIAPGRYVVDTVGFVTL